MTRETRSLEIYRAMNNDVKADHRRLTRTCAFQENYSAFMSRVIIFGINDQTTRGENNHVANLFARILRFTNCPVIETWFHRAELQVLRASGSWRARVLVTFQRKWLNATSSESVANRIIVQRRSARERGSISSARKVQEN